MDDNGAKKFFFITTYDNISSEIINILLLNHPGFRCQLNPQSTLLPIISNKSLQEYIHEGSGNGFAGNIKNFTAFSFYLAKRKVSIQENINIINVTMPISLRVKLLLHSWLNLGLSETEVYQRLITELQIQEIADLLNLYNFNAVYKTLLLQITTAIEKKGLKNSVDIVSPQAKIFYIALALSIALDEMDNTVCKQTIALDSMLKNPEEFFNLLNVLSSQPINTSPECKEKIISLINNFNQIITQINRSEFSPFQNDLINWYFDNDINKQLRVGTIQSSFLSLTYAINLLENKMDDDRFDISNNQLILKNNNIHYELILLYVPMQMRDKNLILPKSVLQNKNNPNTRFLYDLSYEAITFGLGNQEDWVTMHRLLEDAGVPSDKVYFISSNYSAKKYYVDWADKHNIHYRFNVLGNHYWPMRRAYELAADKEFQKIKHQLIDVAKKTVENNIHRPYYFMCLNLKTRLIRTALLLFLLQRNYFSKGIITYLGRSNLSPSQAKISEQNDLYFSLEEVDQFFNRLPDGKLLLQYFDQLEEMTPLVYDVKADDNFNVAWPLKQLIPELGKYGKIEQFESYFEIVTETYFLNEDTLNITEKTIKPILRFQMFIIVGSPHTLSTLRELGFQTFAPYIDETYDTITDPVQRFICITKEIDRLCSLSIEELHDLYCSLWPRILHNYKRFTQDANEFLTCETDKLLEELIS